MHRLASNQKIHDYDKMKDNMDSTIARSRNARKILWGGGDNRNNVFCIYTMRCYL